MRSLETVSKLLHQVLCGPISVCALILIQRCLKCSVIMDYSPVISLRWFTSLTPSQDVYLLWCNISVLSSNLISFLKKNNQVMAITRVHFSSQDS